MKSCKEYIRTLKRTFLTPEVKDLTSRGKNGNCVSSSHVQTVGIISPILWKCSKDWMILDCVQTSWELELKSWGGGIVEFYFKRKENYKTSNIFWFQKARGYANKCTGWDTGNALCLSSIHLKAVSRWYMNKSSFKFKNPYARALRFMTQVPPYFRFSRIPGTKTVFSAQITIMYYMITCNMYIPIQLSTENTFYHRYQSVTAQARATQSSSSYYSILWFWICGSAVQALMSVTYITK